MTDTHTSPASAGEEYLTLYRKSPSPEVAAVLAAMAEKRAAPKKAKKAAPKKRKPSAAKHQHNAQLIAWHDHKRATFLAEFRARYPPRPVSTPQDCHVLIYRHQLHARKSAEWIAALNERHKHTGHLGSSPTA